jgi:hypothetical protein
LYNNVKVENGIFKTRSKVEALGAEFTSVTKAIKKKIEASHKIENKLVDSYFATDDGKKFSQCDMTDVVMAWWMTSVKAEQAFLPPSARLSDEHWQSALASKIEPEAELARQRQSKIRDILLNRLTPNFDTGQYDVADLEEKFSDLDLGKAE